MERAFDMMPFQLYSCSILFYLIASKFILFIEMSLYIFQTNNILHAIYTI